MSDSIGPRLSVPRSFWLDACRSLAIIMVLMSHGRHFLTPAWESAAVFRIGGFLGVELFFVLSGFLIGNIVWTNFSRVEPQRSWVPGFIARRALRTLPTYYLFLLVNVLLISNAVVPGHIGDLWPFIVFAQNLAWPHPMVFGEAWSLAVEEVFYLILPFCLVLSGLICSRKRVALFSVAALILFLPLAARIIAIELSDPPWDSGIRKVVMFRLDSLMVGVLVSWLVREYPAFNRIKMAPALAAAILVIGGSTAIFFLNERDIDTNAFVRIWLFPMISLGFVLLVVSGLAWHQAPSIIGAPAAILARWSYALYLAHMPVFHIIVWSRENTPPTNPYEAFTRWAVFIAGSVCVAAVVERFFERPVLRWRDRIVPR